MVFFFPPQKTHGFYLAFLRFFAQRRKRSSKVEKCGPLSCFLKLRQLWSHKTAEWRSPEAAGVVGGGERNGMDFFQNVFFGPDLRGFTYRFVWTLLVMLVYDVG